MRNYISERLRLLKIYTVNSFNEQTAYFFENWAGVASTTFYTVTMILFAKILYSNIKFFAGYNFDEMILLLTFGQLNFYSEWLWSVNNLLEMIENVWNGDLDLLLVKPIPSLFHVTFRNISLVNRLKDGLPNLLILCLVINWNNIHSSFLNIAASAVIFVCGQISWHCFRFLFALTVFFSGQSTQVFQFSGILGETYDIPFEGFSNKLRMVFTSIIPSLISAQMAVSVFLGKSNALYMTGYALAVATVLICLKKVGWIIALRNYSSASS